MFCIIYIESNIYVSIIVTLSSVWQVFSPPRQLLQTQVNNSLGPEVVSSPPPSDKRALKSAKFPPEIYQRHFNHNYKRQT